VEHDKQSRLEKLRDEMESEHQSRCEDLEKKFAYKMEQLRQELADKHEQVTAVHSVLLCMDSRPFNGCCYDLSSDKML